MDNFLQEPPITKDDLVAALRVAFPAKQPEIVDFIGGCRVTCQIWHFQIRLTLTHEAMTYKAQENTVLCTFTFEQPTKLGLPVLPSVTVKDVRNLRVFVSKARGAMQSVLAEISSGLDDPPPERDGELL